MIKSQRHRFVAVIWKREHTSALIATFPPNSSISIYPLSPVLFCFFPFFPSPPPTTPKLPPPRPLVRLARFGNVTLPLCLTTSCAIRRIFHDSRVTSRVEMEEGGRRQLSHISQGEVEVESESEEEREVGLSHEAVERCAEAEKYFICLISIPFLPSILKSRITNLGKSHFSTSSQVLRKPQHFMHCLLHQPDVYI